MSVVTTDLTRGVLTVTLADEANRNALGGQLVSELMAVLDEAETDPAVRVIVLTNTGKVFCAGANLAERSSTAAPASPARSAGSSARFATPGGSSSPRGPGARPSGRSSSS